MGEALEPTEGSLAPLLHFLTLLRSLQFARLELVQEVLARREILVVDKSAVSDAEYHEQPKCCRAARDDVRKFGFDPSCWGRFPIVVALVDECELVGWNVVERLLQDALVVLEAHRHTFRREEFCIQADHLVLRGVRRNRGCGDR